MNYEMNITEVSITEMLEEIKQYPNWVNWDPGAKDPKCPMIPLENRAAKSNDPSTWRSYEMATHFNEPHIGFMFGNSPVVGIDLDHCIDNGIIADWAVEIIDTVNSYTEFSPSGHGIHILAFCADKSFIKHNKKGDFEIYGEKRYFRLSQNVLKDHSHICERQKELEKVYNSFFPQSDSARKKEHASDDEIIRRLKLNPKYARLFEGDTAEYESESEADIALCGYLAFQTKKNADQIARIMWQSKLTRPKWSRPMSESDPRSYLQYTIDKAIENSKVARTEKHERPEKFPLTWKILSDFLAENNIAFRVNGVTRKLEASNIDVLKEYLPRGYDSLTARQLLNVSPLLIEGALIPLLKKQGYTFSADYLRDGLNSIAAMNEYNPIAEMLTNINQGCWDQCDRLQTLYEIMGISDNPRYCNYVKKWLWQAVAMVFNDGSLGEGNFVLTLQGPEGAGKTRFFKFLAVKGEWFQAGKVIDLRNKDSLIIAVSTWITELGEVDETFSKEQAGLKAFITDSKDTFRRPFGKVYEESPRRTVFAATVNPERFLGNSQGSRRWAVVKVNKIDTARMQELAKGDFFVQLWKQVYEDLYFNNPTGYILSREEIEEMKQANLELTDYLPGEATILDKLNWDQSEWRYVSSTQVLEALCIRGVTAEQVGKVLTKLSKRNPKIEKKRNKYSTLYLLPMPRD